MTEKPLSETEEFHRRWTFPGDEEAREWLRQRDEDVPKMELRDQLDWWTRFYNWYAAE